MSSRYGGVRTVRERRVVEDSGVVVLTDAEQHITNEVDVLSHQPPRPAGITGGHRVPDEPVKQVRPLVLGLAESTERLEHERDVDGPEEHRTEPRTVGHEQQPVVELAVGRLELTD